MSLLRGVLLFALAVCGLYGAGELDPAFNPRGGTDGPVVSIVPLRAGKTFVAGLFTRYGGAARPGLVLVNDDGSADTTFAPQIDIPATVGGVAAVALDGDGRIYIGGAFTRVGGTARPSLARLDATGRLDSSFNPELPPDSVVATIAVAPDGGVFVGGNFRGSTSATPGLSLLKLRSDGRIDPSFPALPMRGQDEFPFVNQIVPLADGGVLIGGDFTEIAGAFRPFFARLRANGAIDPAYPLFPFYAHVWVSDIDLLADGTIYVSGTMVTEGGSSIARLLPSGALDPSFNVRLQAPDSEDRIVNSLHVLPDGRLLAAGNFTHVNGTARPYLARLFDDGAVDTTFTPALNDEVVAVHEDSSGRFWIGGLFTGVNGSALPGVARLSRTGDGPLLRSPAGPITATAGNNLVLASTLFGADTVQWYRNGVPVPGATRSTLALAVATTADSGNYTVVAANPHGTLNSAPFRIEVTAPQFGTANLTAANVEPFNTTLALTLLADGSVVACEGGTEPRLRRYGSDFKPLGVTSIYGFRFTRIDAVAADPQQRLYLRGQFELADRTTRMLVRLLPDGSHDTNFETAGVIARGKFLPLADGSVLLHEGDAPAMARLLPAGRIDPAFPRRNATFAVQPDGRILYGVGRDLSLGPINIGRLHADGTPDPSFTPPTVSVPGRNNVPWPVDSVDDIIVLSSGDIAVSVNGDFAYTSVLWLRPNGALRGSYTEPNVQQRVFRFFAADVDGAVYASGVGPGAMRLLPGGPAQRMNSFFSVVDAWSSPLHGAILRVQMEFNNDRLFGVAQIATQKPGPFRLVNLSSRGVAGEGDGALILGFVVQGTAQAPFLVRGVGPTLQAFGVGNADANPAIELFRGTERLAVNDDWGTGGAVLTTLAQQVGAFPLAQNSRDAALAPTLGAGAFTAVIASRAANPGVALGEIYLTATAGTSLSNLSIRGRVSAGDGALIGGLAIQGESPRWVLVRAIGPGLAPFGVQAALADPVLQLVRNGATLAQNDNWDVSRDAALLESAARKGGAFALPTGSRDAALFLLLPPGNYTAVVQDRDSRPGAALLEVYALVD